MKTSTILLSLTLLGSTLFAKPNLPPPADEVHKLETLAGRAGPFNVKENFPHDYFLISKNLPFLIGLALYHPASSDLELSKEQIDKLLHTKQTLTDKATPIALKVKELELEIVHKMVFDEKKTKAKSIYPKLEEVAKLRVELSKIHLDCIEGVRDILSDEQFEELLDYGVVNF